MPAQFETRAAASVVIPTYNRCQLLRHTLETLTAQRFPLREFEVIISDDGSSDATAEVVRSFQTRLRLRYWFQPDLGFRAAAARNAGARLASAPLLIFMDTGTLAGPGFVGAHLAANPSDPGCAVIGDTFGYRPHDALPDLAQAITELSPEAVMKRYRGVRSFHDWRVDELEDVGFDIGARAVPWLMFWGTNISVRATEFWAAGGFDEDFCGWGSEDIELGLRLYQRAIPFLFSRDAWAIESPHERDPVANLVTNQRNALRLLHKHPEPVAELTWAFYMRDEIWPIEHEYRALTELTRAMRGLDTRDEVARIVRDWPAHAATRIAIVGCGGSVPSSLPDGCVLMDFDKELLRRATADGRHVGHHAIGLRTALPDQSVDLVILTSRLSGLWAEWRTELLAEGHRIGRSVQIGELDTRLATPQAEA